jgi:hypothetical protein
VSAVVSPSDFGSPAQAIANTAHKGRVEVFIRTP